MNAHDSISRPAKNIQLIFIYGAIHGFIDYRARPTYNCCLFLCFQPILVLISDVQIWCLSLSFIFIWLCCFMFLFASSTFFKCDFIHYFVIFLSQPFFLFVSFRLPHTLFSLLPTLPTEIFSLPPIPSSCSPLTNLFISKSDLLLLHLFINTWSPVSSFCHRTLFLCLPCAICHLYLHSHTLCLFLVVEVYCLIFLSFILKHCMCQFIYYLFSSLL